MSLINSFASIGPKGPKGDKGDKGDTGNTGATGATGATGIGCKNFTTSEQDTGLTWINGKKIYKKTIEFGAGPTGTSKSVPHGINNLDMVIRIDTMSTKNDTQIMVDSSFMQTDLGIYVFYMRQGSNIVCETNVTNLYLQTIYVTLWYTKK